MNEQRIDREVKVGHNTFIDVSPKYAVVYNLTVFKEKNYSELRKIEKRINELEDQIVAKGKGFIFYLEGMDITLLGTLKDDLIIISHIEDGKVYE